MTNAKNTERHAPKPTDELEHLSPSTQTDSATCRELTAAEIDQVCGGLVVIAIIAILIGYL